MDRKTATRPQSYVGVDLMTGWSFAKVLLCMMESIKIGGVGNGVGKTSK